MKFNFNIKNVQFDEVRVEEVAVAVEYSVEEMTAVIGAWKDALPQIIAFVAKMEKREAVERDDAAQSAQEKWTHDPRFEDVPF